MLSSVWARAIFRGLTSKCRTIFVPHNGWTRNWGDDMRTIICMRMKRSPHKLDEKGVELDKSVPAPLWGFCLFSTCTFKLPPFHCLKSSWKIPDNHAIPTQRIGVQVLAGLIPFMSLVHYMELVTFSCPPTFEFSPIGHLVKVICVIGQVGSIRVFSRPARQGPPRHCRGSLASPHIKPTSG